MRTAARRSRARSGALRRSPRDGCPGRAAPRTAQRAVLAALWSCRPRPRSSSCADWSSVRCDAGGRRLATCAARGEPPSRRAICRGRTGPALARDARLLIGRASSAPSRLRPRGSRRPQRSRTRPTTSSRSSRSRGEQGAAARSSTASRARFGQTVALAGVDLRRRGGRDRRAARPERRRQDDGAADPLGLRRPDRGRARLFGLDPRRIERPAAGSAAPRRRRACRRRSPSRETVDLVRRIPASAGLDRGAARPVRARLDVADRQNGGLSGGQRRRLARRARLRRRPRPRSSSTSRPRASTCRPPLVWDGGPEHAAAGGAVLLTTHHLEEAEALATPRRRDRRRPDPDGGHGRGDPRRGRASRRIRVAADDDPIRARVWCAAKARTAPRRCTSRDAAAAIRELVARGRDLLDGLEVASASLEEALARARAGSMTPRAPAPARPAPPAVPLRRHSSSRRSCSRSRSSLLFGLPRRSVDPSC